MDNKKLLHEEIAEILKEINSRVNILRDKHGLYEIEKDILLSELRNLYSLVNKIEINPAKDQSSLNISEKEKIPEVKIPPQQDIPFKDELIEMPEEKIKVIPHMDFPEDSPIKNIEPKSSTSIADRYQSETSLHEKIGKSKEEKSVADQIKKPISDLKTGIGLNEKFLFINKLYKGKAEAFEKDISHINSLSGASEAKNYLKEGSWTAFEWNENDEVLENFLNLIERRFLN